MLKIVYDIPEQNFCGCPGTMLETLKHRIWAIFRKLYLKLWKKRSAPEFEKYTQTLRFQLMFFNFWDSWRKTKAILTDFLEKKNIANARDVQILRKNAVYAA